MSGKNDLYWKSPNQGPSELQYTFPKHNNHQATFNIISMNGEQHISDLACYRLHVTSKQNDLKADDFLGKSASFELMVGHDLKKKKTFSGIITAFTKSETTFGNLPKEKPGIDRQYNYYLEMKPKMWLLTQKYNSRVFSYTNEEDHLKVVETILKEHKVTFCLNKIEKAEEKDPNKDNAKSAKTKGGGDPDPGQDHPAQKQAEAKPRTYREDRYWVQYRETDYQFVSRLLEEAGRWFYFDHEQDILVLCDTMRDIPWVAPHRELNYSEDKSMFGKTGFDEQLYDLYYQRYAGPNRFIIKDYNYETPSTDWTRETEFATPHVPPLEHYEHTREYADKPQGCGSAMDKAGVTLCETMMEEAVAAAHLGRAVSTSRSLQAGYRFKMNHHWIERFNAQWLITSTSISASQGDYTVALKAQLMDTPFRPARKTPHASIWGQQTATIVGPAGSEIYTDDLGRCKIHFHWDRLNPKDEKASMWVRVANGYAGKDYGIQWIPRVGHEVLVSFMDGNPAHPVINGRVYNDTNKPPLPAARKYQNIIKTIKDNHILFDDKDGAELLDLRAQKDMNTLVLANHTLTIGGDANESVGGDKGEIIQGDKSVSVHGDHSLSVCGDNWVCVNENFMTIVDQGDHRLLVASGDKIVDVSAGDAHTRVKGKSTNIIESGYDLAIYSGNYQLDAWADRKVWVNKKDHLSVGSREVFVEKNHILSAENHVIKGTTIQLVAAELIKLQVGTNSITLSTQGIHTQGTSIKAVSKGDHQVAGGLVMIN